MKLTSFRVREFKSITDSNEIPVGQVTCMVGKNESGKTSLLEALYRLNPIVEDDGDFDVTDDYPRMDVSDYQHEVENGTRKPARVVEAVFRIDDTDVANVKAQFGEDIFEPAGPFITFWKDYENECTFRLTLNESCAVRTLIGAAGLPDALETEALKSTTIAELHHFLAASAEKHTQEVKRAKAAADKLPDAEEKGAALKAAKALAETSEAEQLREALSEMYEESFAKYVYVSYLRDKFPKFLYFDEYYQMTGRLNLEALVDRQAKGELHDSDRPMLALIERARLKITDLLKPERTADLKNKLQGASNHLSKQVLQYWSQNKHIQIAFDVRPALSGDPEGMTKGTNLWGEVFDTVHYATTPLGRRSKGFVWFFSFLAYFAQQSQKGDPLILLLDEPGLFLHGMAQGDLLNYIETELIGKHQVIYTTHSPFMVQADRMDRVRIVEDKSMQTDDQLAPELRGTKVSSEFLEVSEDSLFPLQGALGYDIAQTLFVGPNSLIVEGVSDLIYLQTMSSVLSGSGRVPLSSEWTITPVGGSDKVSTFVALIGSQSKLRVATLIDYDIANGQEVENLYKRKLLNKKHVLTFADFCGENSADMEDMFDLGIYLQLVNEEYADHLTAPVSEADLVNRSPRISVRLEEHFKTHPMRGNARYDHYRPARYLASHVTMQERIPSNTLDRFEEAFKTLNDLLS